MTWEKRPFQKPGDNPNFRNNALGVKRPFSELWESPGVFSQQPLKFRKVILGMRNSILGMASHDLNNTKTTILGATPGAIPRIHGNPHERFSFAPPFSESCFKNWGGPRAPDHYNHHFIIATCSRHIATATPLATISAAPTTTPAFASLLLVDLSLVLPVVLMSISFCYTSYSERQRHMNF